MVDGSCYFTFNDILPCRPLFVLFLDFASLFCLNILIFLVFIFFEFLPIFSIFPLKSNGHTNTHRPAHQREAKVTAYSLGSVALKVCESPPAVFSLAPWLDGVEGTLLYSVCVCV